MSRLILTLLLGWSLLQPVYAASAPEATQIKQQLEEAKSEKTSASQTATVEALQSTLNWLDEYQKSVDLTQDYQQVIDDFPKLSRELRQQIVTLTDSNKPLRSNMSAADLDQEILQGSSQLLEESRQAQQEQDRAREISDSLSQLPQQQTDARRALNEIERLSLIHI